MDETQEYEVGITSLSQIAREERKKLEERLSSPEIRFAMTHLPLNTIRRLYLEKGLNRLATYLESTALSKIQEEQRIIIQKEAGPDWVGDCMHRDLEGTRYF